MEKKEYFLGLDIGTDSVGYAVTNTEYDLLKFKGEPAWGVHLFDEANLNTERRAFRTARRRLDRRQQRVQLIQELFAKEIAKVDPAFYQRIANSRLTREEAQSAHTLFDDLEYTDIEYHKAYPTVHHLLVDLMNNPKPHDVRLVYLACAWLAAHRGHFLSEVSQDNIAGLTDFHAVWSDLTEYIKAQDSDTVLPWNEECESEIAEILKKKAGITWKFKQLCAVMFTVGKCPKNPEHFPYQCEMLLKGLCGGKINAQSLFGNEAYAEVSPFQLGDDDEKLAATFSALDDDAELLQKMKAIYDWALLVDILGGESTISAAKVGVYDQHGKDLRLLKKIVHKYLPEQYKAVFRAAEAGNYTSYSAHYKESQRGAVKKCNKEDFSVFLLKLLKNVKPLSEDEKDLQSVLERLETRSFLPKQRDTDNRVIPYQLYLYELYAILKTASSYLPFLNAKDADGLTTAEKIVSVFTFRVPYYVGPLNWPTDKKNNHSWIVRKAGKIYPWNFDKMVDLDASEDIFIYDMINTCTYLPDKKVLPKESLLYQRFTVLNEINNLKIDGTPIPVSVKQELFTNLFMKQKKVSVKRIRDYLISNGHMLAGQSLSGVDEQIKSTLSSYHDFRFFLEKKLLSEEQVEQIIRRITCTEDKARLKKWLKKEFAHLDARSVEQIARLSYSGFGRLSAELLNGITIEGSDGIHTYTILQTMWETNNNLMELLSDDYGFRQIIEQRRQDYYREYPSTLAERMEDMHLSNAVKRPVLRALEITGEVVKAFGAPPAKIFVEMTRGATADQKNKRTKTRRQQLLELYKNCKDEDVRLIQQQLEEMGNTADNQLQSDKLYLYYLQLGRCLYTGQALDLNLLQGQNSGAYNIEHIYPRKQVKDDSIFNNVALVLSEVNGQKDDDFPINSAIQGKMRPFWEHLKKCGLLSDEKFKRLTRTDGFTAEEKMGFVQRQLTETSQSTKAVAELLKERYPDTEIVYVKAQLASEFRQTFECLKSRTYNDLHHAKDAYLNIVTGNVYDMKFSRRWFDANSDYNVKTETIYTHPVVCGGKTVWDGTPMLEKVKKTLGKNTAHLTKYAFCRKGGFFDQMPVKQSARLVPLKHGLPTEIYGGYNKPTVSYFLPVHYSIGKKADTIIVPIELLHSPEFLSDASFAQQYAIKQVEKLIGKTPEVISFPMGMRIWKTNTMLSLDGMRILIVAKYDNDYLSFRPFILFAANQSTEFYIKKLEVLVEKVNKNPNYIYSPKYDIVTCEQNILLYKLYIKKLKDTIWGLRPKNPVARLENGLSAFEGLSEIEQSKVLLNIHSIFSHAYEHCDLSPIGGVTKDAKKLISNKVSNWRKNYKDIRIIDTSASGLWEKKSENLLEIL